VTVPILRSYQRAALVAARASVDDGKRCPLVVSPTGSGKSTMAAMIVRSATKRERRCVWLAHRRELRDQAVETLDRCEVDAGHSGQGRHKLAQVVSTQGALVREEMPEADVVIVDEAHHYAADEWSRLLLAYPTQNIYGFTATPERPDGRGMGHMFDSLVVVAQPRELVEAGHLVDCGPENIYRPAQLQEPGFLTCSPLDAYKAHGEGGRNVVFAASIEQACTFAADFKKAGYRRRDRPRQAE
jgi:DNA repair protein RadD